MAVRDEEGRLAAVISTPTLFQYGQTEEGYLRASATIFFWIAIIGVLVVPALFIFVEQYISRSKAVRGEAP